MTELIRKLRMALQSANTDMITATDLLLVLAELDDRVTALEGVISYQAAQDVIAAQDPLAVPGS